MCERERMQRRSALRLKKRECYSLDLLDLCGKAYKIVPRSKCQKFGLCLISFKR